MAKGSKPQKLSATRTLLAGSPKAETPRKVRTTFYINAEIYKQFQELVATKGKTTSEVVESCMVDLLRDFPD